MIFLRAKACNATSTPALRPEGKGYSYGKLLHIQSCSNSFIMRLYFLVNWFETDLYKPERLYLFGSWARSEEDELSDLDLIVIKDTRSPFFDRLRGVSRLLPAEVGGVNILVYTLGEFAKMQKEGNAFAEMIVEEASLIYDWKTKI